VSTALRGSSLQSSRVPVAQPSRLASISLWEIYKFSYFLALRALSPKYAKTAAQLLLEPCTYWRNMEVPAVINHLEVGPGDRVLDIGSPKLASLFIWHRLRAEVYATDLFPYFIDQYSHLYECLHTAAGSTGYHIETQDGRALTYPDCYFDKVYAVSVLEHIEDDGDSQAMREIARVLKPGGTCCLTIPVAAVYREDTAEAKLYYKDSAPGRPVFWQRRYDPESLESRLTGPSGLTLTKTEYYGERWFPYERFYEWLPRFFRIVASLPGPLFSKLFLVRLSLDDSPGAKAVLLQLRKE
jgi:SAM-dependent methyltransferase